MRDQFDAKLKDRAEVMVEEIVIAATEPRSHGQRTPPVRHFNPSKFPGYYFQVLLADGRVIDRSRNIEGGQLPFSDAARASRTAGQAVLETVPGGSPTGTREKGNPLRLLTLFHKAAANEPFFLQIAVGTATLEHSIRRLRYLACLVVSLPLLVGAIAAWRLTRRSMAPLTHLATAMDLIHAERLSLHIEPPKGRDEIANLIAKMNLMLERLAHSFLSQERFIADAAHELKTPLAVLLSEAQLLMQRNPGPGEYACFVADVQEEVRLLAQTVDSLLTLARAAAGIPAENMTFVSINEAVMDAVERCHPLAAQREVRLVPTLAMADVDTAPPAVRGDAGLLTLMVTNLIRNAVRYSPPGQSVDVLVRVAQGNVCISVRDRGPGIPAELVNRVFDRFFRAPDPNSTFKGVGLGLAIVRGIARMHGGEVEVQNALDGGCLFTVIAPLNASPWNTIVQTW